MKRIQRFSIDKSIGLLYLLSFVQGAVVMIVEVLGAKLVAPVFGNSLFVWSATLGVTLGAMALGYYGGGIISKSISSVRPLCMILVTASILVILMPTFSRILMSATANLEVRLGSLLSLVGYLLIPMTLLAMTSPILIQLLNNSASSTGRIAGRIYAISTLGGILSTFLTGLLLIPFIGMKMTAVIAGLVLIIPVMMIFLNGTNHYLQNSPKAKAVNKSKKKKKRSVNRSFASTIIKIGFPTLLLISFLEGGSVMIIELVGAKILAMYYGTSLMIWTVVLGVTLFALAFGYFFGGYLSQKYSSSFFLLVSLMTGGLWAIIAPVIGVSVMHSFQPLGVQWAAFASILVLLFPSVSSMGMVSPLIIQLTNEKVTDSGKSAGRIYSISTIGGILACFIGGFWMIPNLGIKYTSLIIGLLMFLIGFGFLVKKQWLLSLFYGIMVLGFTFLLIPNQKESDQIKIQHTKVGLLGEWIVADFLVDKEGAPNQNSYERKLLLNGIDQTRTQVGFEPLSLWSYPHKLGAYSSIKPAGSKALLLGMGGGSIAYELLGMGHDLDIVELDANLIPIITKFFKYEKSKSNLYIDDARHYINTTHKTYDLIVTDILQGEVQPGHVLTIESFQKMYDILDQEGILVVNFQGTLNHSDYSKGPLSIFKTIEAAGFKVNYFVGKDEEGKISLSRDIFFIGSKNTKDYKTLLENPRYNEWFPYDNFSYDRLISEERLDLSGAEILVDDAPKLDIINSSAIFNWRRNKIRQNIEKFIEAGLPLY